MEKYTLELSRHEKYLHARVAGRTDTLEVSEAYWMQIRNVCKKEGYDLILVEENFENQMELEKVYSLLVKLIEDFKGITILFVDHEMSHYHINKFAETAAGNQGVACYVFNNMDDAYQKLNQIIERFYRTA